MSTDPLQNHKPIGYLARRLDEAITEYVDTLMTTNFEVGRRHWQLMRRVHDSPALPAAEYIESAKVFYGEDVVRDIIGTVESRGWLTRSPDSEEMTLTEQGEVAFARMKETQDNTWDALLKGLTMDDYITVVTLLEKMIDNLEE